MKYQGSIDYMDFYSFYKLFDEYQLHFLDLYCINMNIFLQYVFYYI